MEGVSCPGHLQRDAGDDGLQTSGSVHYGRQDSPVIPAVSNQECWRYEGGCSGGGEVVMVGEKERKHKMVTICSSNWNGFLEDIQKDKDSQLTTF